MKQAALIITFCALLGIAGCGGEDSSAGNDKTQAADKAQTADDAGQGSDAKPEIQPSEGPPPSEVFIEELEEGSGPAAKAGDELSVRFVAVDQSGKEIYDTWSQKTPFSFKLGTGEYGTGWDEGLTGAKAGSRRELTIPKAQSYEKSGPLYYVVDVIDVKPVAP